MELSFDNFKIQDEKQPDSLNLNSDTETVLDQEESSINEGDDNILDITSENTDTTKSDISTDTDSLNLPNDALIDLTNMLAKSNLLSELPEGVDQANYGSKDFVKVIEHNFNKKLEETVEKTKNEVVEQFFGNLSERVQKLVEYELQGGDDVETLLKTMVHAKELEQLDINDVSDQARILREYYLQQGETSQEIEERIQDFIDNGLLAKEAARIKPKLDKKIEDIAAQKIATQKQLAEYEKSVRTQLESKVKSIINKGSVNGIPITKEAATFLINGIVNDDIPITFKGKKQNVSLDQALVLYHKYDSKGDVERLMEALLLLQYPEQVREHYNKKAITKEADLFKKDHSYSAATKTGKLIEKPLQKRQGFILSRPKN